MKWVVSIVLFFSFYSFGQNYSHIFELRGLEDSLNNIHLFYRYVYPTTTCWSKNIYHIDVVNNIDTFFIWDSGGPDPIYGDCEGEYVNDYEFFNNDPSKFIYCGYDLWIDPVALLRRYDGEIQLEAFALTEIEISQQNDSLVYVSAGPLFFKSSDGGYNYVRYDSMQFIDASIISLSKNNDSQIYGIDDNKLVRSENDGTSYYIVDNSSWQENTDLFYDADSSHIYGLSVAYIYSTHSYLSNIYISDDNGNPFTWNELVEYPDRVWFTLDEFNSGEIYYSAGKQIFKSSDYGTNFNLFKELPFKITGLYKKSGTYILYASTPLKIYEITPDTINIIKSLPIPDEVLNYYPLTVGNKWVYNTWGWWWDGTTYHTYSGILTREVIGDSVMPNGKLYYELNDPTTLNYPFILFERIDSISGKVYRYDNTLGLTNDEYLIDDLFAEVGDTIWSSRHQYQQNNFPFICVGVGTFNKWGIQSPRKIFNIDDLTGYTYSLSQRVGIDSIYSTFDFGENFATLKGCIIDGTVYGDTTLVSVEDETENFPTEFSLSQNYPNPFNPNTKIKFTIPTSPLNPSPYQGEGQRERLITLKIYDVLGNEVATLVNEEKPAGSYEVEFNGNGLPSGVYFYQLKAGSFIETKKMVLLK